MMEVTYSVIGPMSSLLANNEGGFFMQLVTAEGGLTGWGYAVSILAMVLLVLAAVYLRNRSKHSLKLTTRQLVFCAAAMALSFVTSFIKVWSLPFGGSVTLFSMLFVCLIGNWYGPGVGILTGLAYGILQFLQEPYVLSPFQVCCDYVLAFAGLGLSGLVWKQKNALVKGYILGILVRGLFHTIGGYLYWMDYMPENFPEALAPVYPIVYNYAYILLEGVITVIVIKLPPVEKALAQVKRLATQEN